MDFIYCLEVALAIGFLIFVHELGHFLVAKKIGVRVDAFSLGFGPVLLKFSRGATEYRLSAIPLGGYVKLAGENPDEEATGSPEELRSRTPGERAAVFAAGVVMNFIFAFLGFIIAFRVGVPFESNEIGTVELGSPAWEAGIETGDKILEIDGAQKEDFEDVRISVAFADPDKELSLQVERDGHHKIIKVKPKYDPYLGAQRIGVASAVTLKVGKIFKMINKGDGDSPAQKAGVEVGDQILEADGKKVSTWGEFKEIIRSNPNREIALKVLRGEDTKELRVTPRPVERPMIGVQGRIGKAIVKRGSLADRSGFVTGDIIISADGKEISRWSELDKIVESSIKQAEESPSETRTDTISVTVTRKGQIVGLEDVRTHDLDRNLKLLDGLYPKATSEIAYVEQGSPADEAGIRKGDRITKVNAVEISSFRDLVDAILSWGEKGEKESETPLDVEFRRGSETRIVQIRPKIHEDTDRVIIGLMPQSRKIERKYDFGEACVVGCEKAIVNVKLLYLAMKGFITKQVSVKNVGGIILIAQASYLSARQGFGRLLYFFGIIGINLAVINLFPIPVLDGGHLLFLGIEKLKGSPVSERTQMMAQYVGLIVILGLVLFTIVNDLNRIFPLF